MDKPSGKKPHAKNGIDDRAPGEPDAAVGAPVHRDVDPVQEALAKVEAVVSKTGEYYLADPLGKGPVGETVSLKQVIKSMEARLVNSLGASDSKTPSLPEELESLDIEADLGRPDDSDASPVPPDATLSGGIGGEEAAEARGSAVAWDASTEMISLRMADGERNLGDLSQDPLWSLLVAIFSARRDGMLTLAERGVERSFLFSDGNISTVSSTAVEDRIIEVLHDYGRLDDAKYREARLAVGSGERQVVSILAERGIINKKEIFPLVRFHLESVVFDSFGWRSGSWRFISGSKRGKQRIPLNVPTPAIVFEGLRLKARQEDIDAIVTAESRLLALPGGVCGVEELGLDEHETEILRACDGSVNAAELAQRFGLDVLEMKRIAAGFVVLGLLQTGPAEAYRQRTEDEL